MIDLNTPFTIDQAGRTLKVTPRKAGGSTVFVIQFPDGNQPLAITKASGEKRPIFWTSIPEGRQKEAEQIGPMITAHYQGLALLNN